MDHYKEINKELVQHNQQIRIDLKDYREEIVSLKAQLSEQYETFVLFKKQHFNFTINKFRDIINNIEPDSDILGALSNIESVTEQRRSSSERRSSGQLLEDLRQRNSVINSRQSMRSTSPVRRNAVGIAYEEEVANYEAPTGTMRNIIHEEPEEQDQEDEAEEEQEEDSVYEVEEEDSEETEEDDNEEEVVDAISNNNNNKTKETDSILPNHEDISEESTIEISHSRATLGDITNRSNTNTKRKVKESVQKNSNQSGTTKRDNQRNTQHFSNNSMDVSHVCTSPYECNRAKCHLHKSHTLQPEDSIQVQRNYNGNFNNNSVPMINITQNKEDNLTIPPISFSDLSLTFKVNASSTPNSRRKSKKNYKPKTPPPLRLTTTTTEESATTEEPSTFSRPSRRCKPENMAEPKLNCKLRNESETRKKNSKSKKLVK